MPDSSLFHVLLIGVDRYDKVLGQLHGCVNDIDAVEKLFTEEPGVGFPMNRTQVTRLVSRHANEQSRGAAVEQRGATRDEILDSLEELHGRVGPEDRVHIHYSGHGGQFAWKKEGTETGAWSEGLLTSDGDWVTDMEINAWLHAISRKTEDVTVVLDCCHASGVSRGAQPPETFSRGGAGASALPAPGHGGLRRPSLDVPATGGLKDSNSGFVVLAACQSHEEAQEKKTSDGGKHGMLTFSFVKTISALESAEERAALKWADLWPDLLETAEDGNPARGPQRSYL
jgi:hypothetical protein